MKNFKAVLCDLDGTIAKTMESYFSAWKKACEDFGFRIDKSDYYPLEGMEAHELAKTLCQNCGGDKKNIKKIVERKKNYFIQMFENRQADLYPGVEKLLNVLSKVNVKTALVTASIKEQIDASISSKVLEKFDVIVSGEMSGRGKPFPDPYLKGAELLGIDPKDCVAVENAPLGVKSAKAAGMYCIAMAHTVSKDELKEADIVLPVFEELSKFFHDIRI